MTPYLKRRCQCKRQGRKDCRCPWFWKKTTDGHTYQGPTGSSNRQLAGRLAEKLYENAHAKRTGQPLPYPDLTDPGADRIRLHTLAAEYLKWAAVEHASTGADKDPRIIGGFLDVVDPRRDLYVDDVSPILIHKWRHHRAQSVKRSRVGKPLKSGALVSKQTVNTEQNHVQKMFTKGAEWHGTPHPFKPSKANPDGIGQFENLTEKPIRLFSRDELRIIFAPKGGLPHPFNLFGRVTIEALPRISEILALRRGDVGVELAGLERVGWLARTLKRGKRLIVPIPVELADDLLAELRTPDQQFLFPWFIKDPRAKTKRELTKRISYRFKELFTALGIEGHHHMFRHLGITQLLIAGYGAEYVAELAGLSSTRMIKRYGHIVAAVLRQATESNAAWLRNVLAEKPGTVHQPDVLAAAAMAGGRRAGRG